MESFAGRLAVVTGGGTGMGRELCVQLATSGAHLALCDVSEAHMAETAELARKAAPGDIRISCHVCDVADERQVLAFRDAALEAHDTNAIHLLFNNAGIGGAGSFVADERDMWERTFNVCWYGVYYCARAFLPDLMEADEAHIVNTSSINGFWASLGPNTPHTAYCAAKFAVKGFSEALITDLRMNAPHVGVSVVMPGHIGTQIAANSMRIQGRDPASLPAEDIAQIREQLAEGGAPVGNLPDDDIRALIAAQAQAFESEAPTTAASAAEIILAGVRENRWRILVGDDAHAIDAEVRANPEQAYEASFTEHMLGRGHFAALIETAGQAASAT